tara:strand:- start:5051 stop:5713 length:663 start_codon:yes stop_codon:yes gene_type:complete
MIPKKIHQIYYDLSGKSIEEIPMFANSSKDCQKFPDYEYKLWTREECEQLLHEHYPEWVELYDNFRFEIQKIDFIRMCILHKHGGFYIDLDMFILKKFDELLNNDYVFHNVRNVKPRWSYIENDFMGSKRDGKIWLYMMSYCAKVYQEKSEMSIYDVWKGRFVLQTTGPKMIANFIKKNFPKYKPMRIVHTEHNQDPTDDYYIKDFKANTWIKNQSGIVL